MQSPWLRLSAVGNALRHEGVDAQTRQLNWLRACLRRSAGTAIGRRHGFGRIQTVDEYRRIVPLSVYEDYRHWIDRVENGDADVLFPGKAVAFEHTGGSTGGSKRIPYSEESLIDFRRAILPWVAGLASKYRLENGCAYFAISPALRAPGITPGGIPVGLPDGAYLGEEALPLLAQLSVVPAWVGDIRALEEWQLATLYWLVVRPDLTLISVWSPTFFLMLMDALEQRSDEAMALLQDGGFIHGYACPADEMARERLGRYRASGDARQLWPRLQLVSAWADGSSRPYSGQLRARLPHAHFQPKGLLSTEGVVTVPGVDDRPVLAVDSGFFEFIDSDGREWLPHELVAGQQYEIAMTTSGGFYRYRTGDVVISEGDSEGLPVLRFVGRCGLTSDLVGEKLTESFVATCLPVMDGFRMLVPDSRQGHGYVLVIDECGPHDCGALAQDIERQLSRNPQYAYARRLGQLKPITVRPTAKPLNAYVQRMTREGMLLGNVKVPALRPETDWLSTFTRS